LGAVGNNAELRRLRARKYRFHKRGCPIGFQQLDRPESVPTILPIWGILLRFDRD